MCDSCCSDLLFVVPLGSTSHLQVISLWQANAMLEVRLRCTACLMCSIVAGIEERWCTPSWLTLMLLSQYLGDLCLLLLQELHCM